MTILSWARHSLSPAWGTNLQSLRMKGQRAPGHYSTAAGTPQGPSSSAKDSAWRENLARHFCQYSFICCL